MKLHQASPEWTARKIKKMPTISQFCLTCGEENVFDLTESEVDQFLDELNLPPVEGYSEVIQVPPDDCDFCNINFYGVDDDEDWY